MSGDLLKGHSTITGVHIYASHKEKYCWVRIPKCGSSTVVHILEKNCKWDYHEYDAPHTGWLEYFKFTFVRNPWDRIYSCFEQKVRSKGGNCSDYLNQFPRNIKFSEWVKTITLSENILKDRHFAPMYTLMINKSFDSMDFVGKLENLQEDFNIICDKIKIPQQKLPHKNKTKHKHYTEYYNEETKQIVAEKYTKDIEMFGYEFGE
jgi:chondroitin 4-sulfotransferase 11